MMDTNLYRFFWVFCLSFMALKSDVKISGQADVPLLSS